MEHDYSQEVSNYKFHGTEQGEKYFAETLLRLLQGYHIQREDLSLYDFLEDSEDEMANYLARYFKVRLTKKQYRSECYYFVERTDTGLGVMNSRHSFLGGSTLLFAFILVDMLMHEKSLHINAEISWDDIRQYISKSAHSELYKKKLLGSVKEEYTHKEWDDLDKKKFGSALRTFRSLGWVYQDNAFDSDRRLTIRASMHRVVELYENEIRDPRGFIESHMAQKEKET